MLTIPARRDRISPFIIPIILFVIRRNKTNKSQHKQFNFLFRFSNRMLRFTSETLEFQMEYSNYELNLKTLQVFRITNRNLELQNVLKYICKY